MAGPLRKLQPEGGGTVPATAPRRGLLSRAGEDPVARLIAERVAYGFITLVAVSIVVFAATQLLPGNAAYAVLGRVGSQAQLHRIEAVLGLNKPITAQYWHWVTGMVGGNLGTSLVNGEPVGHLIGGRALNSAALVVLAGIIGTVVGVVLGVIAAVRRDKLVDRATSSLALGLTALPEFVVGIAVVLVFATNLLRVLPAVSPISPGQPPWADPTYLVLPTATLALVIIPYIFRMTRGAAIEALESEYMEMALLRGVPWRKVLVRDALPNMVPMVVQAIGLSLLYLAGGIVLVEVVFDYPGLGQGLVEAVSTRDIPTIQAIVLLLASFYVVLNILTDVIALLATPRRRFPK